VSGPFQPLGAQHLGALLAIGVAAALAGLAAARAGAGPRRALRLFLAANVAAYAGLAYSHRLGRGGFHPAFDLPLHLCDLMEILAMLCLVCPRQGLFEIVYYLGLAGSTQALLTPELLEGFPSWPFLEFFWGHGTLFAALAVLIWGEGLRPRPGSLWRAMLALNLWAAGVGLLNALFGWNYGYLSGKPQTPSLLDSMGPWPWYLLTGEGVALGMFWLLYLPWQGCRARRSRQGEPWARGEAEPEAEPGKPP
jgi:hypothetical integral membrane protein (TIGR02206 family)